MGSPAERVRELVDSSGMSHGEFAVAVGLDPSKLSKSLSGVRRFSSVDLARIAELTQVSVDWLVTGQESALATAARRSGAGSVDRAIRHARELAGLREDLAFLGYAQPWRPVSRVTGAKRAVDQGNALALAALRWLREADLDSTGADLVSVVEAAFGVDVAVVAVGEGVDGLAASTDGARLILLNPTPVPARQRFTLAHELGHLLAGDDQGVHLDEDIFGSKSKTGESEMRANAFAASFLMPEGLLREAVTGGRFDKEAFCALAVRLAVSPSALAYRMANLRLIDAMSRDRFKDVTWAQAAQLSGQPGLLAEFTSVSQAERLPALLVRDAFTAYTSGEATLRPYANLIGVDVDTLRSALESAEGT